MSRVLRKMVPLTIQGNWGVKQVSKIKPEKFRVLPKTAAHSHPMWLSLPHAIHLMSSGQPSGSANISPKESQAISRKPADDV